MGFDRSKSIFFDDDITGLDKNIESNIETKDSVEEVNIEPNNSKSYRYRVEQTLIMKSNGIIVSHGITKQEYLMKKVLDKGVISSITLELIENIISFNPTQMETSIELICEIDKIKSLVSIKPSPKTGKMLNVQDKKSALEKFNEYKGVLNNKFSFLKSKEDWQAIELLIEKIERELNDDRLLLGDLQSRIFYDTIFDAYLLGKNFENEYDKYLISNLFAHNLQHFKVAPIILQKSSNSLRTRHVGVLNRKELRIDDLINYYDDFYKPQVGYSFSEYNHTFIGDYTIDTEENIMTEASVVIHESVKNNIEIILDFRLKKIEL